MSHDHITLGLRCQGNVRPDTSQAHHTTRRREGVSGSGAGLGRQAAALRQMHRCRHNFKLCGPAWGRPHAGPPKLQEQTTQPNTRHARQQELCRGTPACSMTRSHAGKCGERGPSPKPSTRVAVRPVACVPPHRAPAPGSPVALAALSSLAAVSRGHPGGGGGSTQGRVSTSLAASRGGMRKRYVILYLLAGLALGWAAVQWAWGTGAHPNPQGALETDSPLLFHAKARPPTRLLLLVRACAGRQCTGTHGLGRRKAVPCTRRSLDTSPSLSGCHSTR